MEDKGTGEEQAMDTASVTDVSYNEVIDVLTSQLTQAQLELTVTRIKLAKTEAELARVAQAQELASESREDSE